MNSFKSLSTIITESTVVGIGLIFVYYIVNYIITNYIPQLNLNLHIKLFISGFIFHVICEYTGVNIWYVKEYSKLMK